MLRDQGIGCSIQARGPERARCLRSVGWKPSFGLGGIFGFAIPPAVAGQLKEIVGYPSDIRRALGAT